MYGEGAGSRRDRIIANALAALHASFVEPIAEGRCRVSQEAWHFGGQGWFKELRPDVTLIWRIPSPVPEVPRLAIEVLGTGEPVTDLLMRLDLYRATKGLAHLLIIEPDKPFILLHTDFSAGPWHGYTRYDAMEEAIWLNHLGAVMGVSEFYRGIFPFPGTVADDDGGR